MVGSTRKKLPPINLNSVLQNDSDSNSQRKEDSSNPQRAQRGLNKVTLRALNITLTKSHSKDEQSTNTNL